MLEACPCDGHRRDHDPGRRGVPPQDAVHASVLSPGIVEVLQDDQQIKVRLVGGVAPGAAAEDEDDDEAITVELAQVPGDGAGREAIGPPTGGSGSIGERCHACSSVELGGIEPPSAEQLPTVLRPSPALRRHGCRPGGSGCPRRGCRRVFPRCRRSFPRSAVFPAVTLRFCCRAAVSRPRVPLLVAVSLGHLAGARRRERSRHRRFCWCPVLRV